MIEYRTDADEKTLILRDNILKLLEAKKNIALAGETGIGKTTLLKEHFRKALKNNSLFPVFIELDKLSLVPEKFSIEFIGNICFWFLKSELKDYKSFLDIQYLKEISAKLKSREAEKLINIVENELQKIKPDQKLLVKTAFDFPEALAKDNKKTCLLCIDDFDNILSFNNFEQIRDVLSLLEFKTPNVSFAISMSLPLELKAFETVRLQPLSEKEAAELVRKIVPGADAKLTKKIYHISKGLPWLVHNLCYRYNEIKNINKAYVLELLWKKSSSNIFLHHYYNSTLGKARGESLIKTILNALAEEDKNGLRLTELAKKIYRSAPVTKSLVERLISVELVEKTDKKFSIKNRVLKAWIKYRYLEFDNRESADDVLKLVPEVAQNE